LRPAPEIWPSTSLRLPYRGLPGWIVATFARPFRRAASWAVSAPSRRPGKPVVESAALKGPRAVSTRRSGGQSHADQAGTDCRSTQEGARRTASLPPAPGRDLRPRGRLLSPRHGEAEALPSTRERHGLGAEAPPPDGPAGQTPPLRQAPGGSARDRGRLPQRGDSLDEDQGDRPDCR